MRKPKHLKGEVHVDLEKAARAYGIFLSLGHPNLREDTRQVLKMELARLNQQAR